MSCVSIAEVSTNATFWHLSRHRWVQAHAWVGVAQGSTHAEPDPILLPPGPVGGREQDTLNCLIADASRADTKEAATMAYGDCDPVLPAACPCR